MAVLVSGASGFLGSRLVKRLVADEYDVIAISRDFPPLAYKENHRIKWIVCDISQDIPDLNDLPEIDAVVHLAGATRGAGDDEDLFLFANERTTINLLKVLGDRTKRIIYASSHVVYGNVNHLSVTENFQTQSDISSYACSKLNTENWLRCFQKSFGGQYIIMRFCGFIDGGGIVDYLINKMIEGDDVELFSEGRVRRDYLTVNDGINAIMSALNCFYTPGFLPINIGSGQLVSAHQLAMVIKEELNSLSQIKLLNKSSPQDDFVFCIDKAKKLLNFYPEDLIEAVRKYAKSKQKKISKL